MRLLDDRGTSTRWGSPSTGPPCGRLEHDVALSTLVIRAVPDRTGRPRHRSEEYVSVNPSLENMNGMTAEEHLGRTVREVLPLVDAAPWRRRRAGSWRPDGRSSSHARDRADPRRPGRGSTPGRCRCTGWRTPSVRCWASPCRSWTSPSSTGRASRRRPRGAGWPPSRDASARIGTTLELDRTAHELADVAVPDLADIAAVDLLEAVVKWPAQHPGPGRARGDPGPGRAGRTTPRRAAGGRSARPGRPSTGRTAWSPSACATARPVLVERVTEETCCASPVHRRRPSCCAGRVCTPTWPFR